MFKMSRFVFLVLLSFGLACSSSPTSGEKPRHNSSKPGYPRVFDQVEGMPFDQVMVTAYNLNRDAVRWRQTLGQISIANNDTGFLLDREVRTLLGDADESLADIEKASGEVAKDPKVADVIAIAFDLSRLQGTVVSIGTLATSADLAPGGRVPVAGPTLRANAEKWQQIAKDVATEIQPYRDGWQSYTFHLGQTIDAAFSN